MPRRRACVVCGEPSNGSRCATHALRPRPDGRTRRSLRATVEQRDGAICSDCGTAIRRLIVDHIIKVEDGGTDHPDNLRLLCDGPGGCHGKRHSAAGLT